MHIVMMPVATHPLSIYDFDNQYFKNNPLFFKAKVVDMLRVCSTTRDIVAKEFSAVPEERSSFTALSRSTVDTSMAEAISVACYSISAAGYDRCNPRAARWTDGGAVRPSYTGILLARLESISSFVALNGSAAPARTAFVGESLPKNFCQQAL